MAPKPSHLQSAATSTAWLLGEKLVILGVSFAVGILLARYLGPSQLGSLNYAIAIAAIIGAVATLGLAGGTVVRELVEEPKAAGEIVGTALVLRLLASSVVIGLAILFAAAIGFKERGLVILILLALPLDAVATLRLFFEANVSSKIAAGAIIPSAMAGAALRLAAIFGQAPLWIFAAIVPLQALIMAGALALVFNRFGLPLNSLRFSYASATRLLRESWPLMLSAAGAVLYLKLDQVMLGEMVGMAEVGVYSVAARLSEVWYILPTAFGASIAPRLLELRQSDPVRYELRIKQAFRYSFWLGAAVALAVTLIATPLIVILYGEAYREAGAILSIHIWTCPAIFVGVVLQKWFLAERLLLLSFGRHLLGAVINIALNLWLIPIWGGVGAAVATLISYTFANVVGCFLGRRTFRVGVWMLGAIATPQLMFSRRD